MYKYYILIILILLPNYCFANNLELNSFGVSVANCYSYNDIISDGNSKISTLSYDSVHDYFWNMLGVFYSNDLFLVEYRFLHTEYQIFNFEITNDKLLFRNELRYSKGKAISNWDNYHHGPGWNDEYLKYSDQNATHYNYQLEAGYIFTIGNSFLNEYSYHSSSIHSKKIKNGFSIGIPILGNYNYSNLESNKSLIPVGEQEYYNHFGTLQGVTINTFGVKVEPSFCFSFEGLYTCFGVKYMLMTINYAEFKNVNESNQTEFNWFENEDFSFPYFFDIGYNGDKLLISLSFDFEIYNRISIPNENRLKYEDNSFDIELKTGYRF